MLAWPCYMYMASLQSGCWILYVTYSGNSNIECIIKTAHIPSGLYNWRPLCWASVYIWVGQNPKHFILLVILRAFHSDLVLQQKSYFPELSRTFLWFAICFFALLHRATVFPSHLFSCCYGYINTNLSTMIPQDNTHFFCSAVNIFHLPPNPNHTAPTPRLCLDIHLLSNSVFSLTNVQVTKTFVWLNR